MDNIFVLVKKLPPLKKKKDPNLAAIIGLIFGGIGLGIYFLSLIDFIILMLIGIILFHIVGDIGWFLGACVASGYGYFRVVLSNEKLKQP